jgi:squalene monooxygenase
VVDAGAGKTVEIPYPGGHEGRSFHHGRLIMNLRCACRSCTVLAVLIGSII